MRNIAVILAVVALLFSCSKEETTTEPTPPESIIGQYRISTLTGNNEIYRFDACFDRTFFTFEAFGTGYHDIYAQNANNGCGVIETGIISWSKSNNTYIINSDTGLLVGTAENAAKNGTAVLEDTTLIITFFENDITYVLSCTKM